ncbi:alpha/beta hydrolase [Saccharopolyspora taberi]|uniref:Alpha/beta hydrolase n=1 Tax=Saccharopolyspora taberi TaxID=60895 RepID=A0ABN3VLX1_9PSEU
MASNARTTSERPAEAGEGYSHHPHWLNYQEFFPGGMRLTAENAPQEEWWSWRGATVHLDLVPKPDAPAILVALHGAGGYGRMLAPYGRLPSTDGLEYVAPDLPGFGLSDPGRRAVTYRRWVDCVVDLIAERRRADPRPVVLLGIGTGGRLAYDVAARTEVAGLVVTCLADPRRGEVRRRLAARPELSSFSGMLALTPWPLREVKVPVHWLANVAAASNNVKFADLVWADPLGGGNWISFNLVRSYLSTPPVVEPEDFRGAPLLLAHPEEDRWLPVLLSRQFFDRVAAPTRFAALRGAGHLPIEETGLADLDRAVRDFLDEIGIG